MSDSKQRNSANTARSISKSGQSSNILFFLRRSFAALSASALDRKGITGKIIRITERTPGERIAEAHITSGSMQSLIETKQPVNNAEHLELRFTLITSSPTKSFQNFALKFQMASRFVFDAIGIYTQHKMKKRLIRWIPKQVMLWAIPSQARWETCLKV